MLFRKKKSERKERGVTLVEAIIVLVIGAVTLSIVVPKGLEFSGKSKSNALQEEYASVVTAFTTLETSNGSSVHAVKANIKDASDNMIMKDYVIPVAPSAAFATVTESEFFRRDSASKKPLTFKYGFNTIGITSETSYKGEFRHVGKLSSAPTAIGGTATAIATSMSSQGAAGLAPIFSVNEVKVLEDFINSPNGLDLGEFAGQLGSTTLKDSALDIALLADLFGGPLTNTNVSYLPFEPTATTSIIVKQPIQLTVVDIESITNSSSGSTYSTLTDNSKGTLYQVTGLMSREEFVKHVTATATIYGTADGNLMYDKISAGLSIGTPLFIPHREKDIIKSTASDLKAGYYRP